MTYSYFPGCTLKTRAKDLDHWGRESMKALGIELAELPEWQCCGAVYPIARAAGGVCGGQKAHRAFNQTGGCLKMIWKNQLRQPLFLRQN